MKFAEYFNGPQYFSHGAYVISGEYSREDAALLFSAETGATVAPDELTADRVRFGFPPESVAGYDSFDGAIWYTGASGKGSKPVWALEG